MVLDSFEIDESGSKKSKVGSFQAMGLEKELLNGILRMGYKVPTPVQRKALPVVLSGLDIVCMARTGSGKTCVFLLPMLQKLKAHQSSSGVRAIVLSPTRELAVQTLKFAKDMAKFTDLRIISIVGGDGIDSQFDALSSRPDALIATPGRLMHMLQEISTFKLKGVQYIVFDEADRLFEMGFAEQLNEIVKQCPEERQTLLFSATMPKMLLQFSRAGLRDPQLIRLDTDVKMSEELRLGFLAIRSNEKLAALLYLVRKIIPANQLTIIFTATRHHSEFLHELLKRIGVSSTLVYGTMDQEVRNHNLKQFRNGEVNYMIVTDLAARGIDVPLLNNVINFHFPASPKMFVHRCGRAARQGRIGFALSLVEPEELPYMVDVHRFLDMEVSTRFLDSSSPSASNSYTLQTMTPQLVHVGILPQDVLDEENDFVKRILTDEDALAAIWQTSENGYKQYRRTRPEASREGVKGMKKLVKENSIRHIHPLIAGCDPDRCNELVVEKANFIRMLQSFRPAQTVLESGIGTGMGSVTIKNLNKPGSKENHGFEAMKALRKQNVGHLERNRKKLSLEAIGTGGDFESDGSDVDNEDARSEDSDNGNHANDDSYEMNGDDEYLQDEFCDPLEKSAAVHEEDDYTEFENTASSGQVKPEKPRLSIAEKKRLKKKGLSNEEISKLAHEKNSAEPCQYTLLDQSSSGGGSHKDSNTFKDSKFYMTYGTEDASATFAEESLQPKSGLRGTEAQSAAQMEGALLDMSTADAVSANKKKKILHWDEKKRKFVKQTLQEMVDHGKKGLKRMRSESGVMASSSKKKGEMYEKWKKKSKREVGDVSAEGDDYRPSPNVRYNSGAKSELKTADEIRKDKKIKDRNRVKNMSKDKRRTVVKKMKSKAKAKGGKKF